MNPIWFISMEARWNFRQVQGLRKLEDIKSGNRVLKLILKPKGSNCRRLFGEIQDMFPFPHHAFGKEGWTRNWNSGNVNATPQSAFEEDWVLECSVRDLNLVIAKNVFLFLVESNRRQSLTG